MAPPRRRRRTPSGCNAIVTRGERRPASGRVGGLAPEPGTHRPRHRRSAVRRLLRLHARLPERRQYSLVDPERLDPRHSRRRHGAGDHRPRHRSVDGGDDGDERRLDVRPDAARRLSGAGAAGGAGDGGGHRPHQRLPDRLCRDPGDLHDAGDGDGGLWLRPEFPGADRHHLSGAVGRLVEGARRRQPVRRPEPDRRLRRALPGGVSCSCASRNGAVSSMRWATTRSARGSPAFRRGR